MSIAKIWQMHSTSSADTEKLGEAIGSRLRGGEVIELCSDLGGGKTTLTRGIVRGAGSNDRVASPTFSISREYTAPRFMIAHYDFYRLETAGVVEQELQEALADPQAVSIIEWSDIVQEVLPAQKLRVTIIHGDGEDTREIICAYHPKLEYLLEEVRC